MAQFPNILAVPKRGWNTVFEALKTRNYRLYWISTLASFFASMMQSPAQSWLTYQITQSPFKLTLVIGVQIIPMLVLSLLSGIIMDRLQKRNLILAAQIVNVVLVSIIAVLIATNQIQYWHLLISSFVSGAMQALSMTSRNAIIAELVPREKIYNAIALLSGGANAASIAGPAISGILIGTFNIQSAYYAAIIFHVIAIVIMFLLPATSKLRLMTGRSVLKNLGEGVKYVRLRHVFLMLLGMELAITIFGMPFQTLMPAIADILNQDSEGYGFMLATIGVGSLLGSIFTASLGNFKKKGKVLVTSGIVFGLFLVIFANTGYISRALGAEFNTFSLAAVLLLVIGFSASSYTSTSNTIIQMQVDDEFRGRVNGLLGMVISFFCLAALLMGTMAELLGVQLALTINASILALLMLGITIFSRKVRRME